MNYLPDHILAHLRTVAELPDLSGTRYELREEIGRGGMGVVYRAHDTVLDRDVALKIVDAGNSEAVLLARLEHPAIVPVYDAGELPGGRHYYAMRLIRGRRLDQFAQTEPATTARLRAFLRVCEAVAYGHSRAVIHGDLKPQNIMIGEFGEVFVLDWGLAAGGTAGYMAPEPAAESRERFDVFSLGRILEGLAGAGSKPLRAIAAKASLPGPELRYGTVQELSDDVMRYLDRLPVSAYRESPLEHARRFAARNQVLLLLLAAYLFVKLAIFFFPR
jgi:serine/threonine protein kinase